MAMFLFFACSAIVICSGVLVDFNIFFQSLEWHLEVIYKTNYQLNAFVRDRYKVQKLPPVLIYFLFCLSLDHANSSTKRTCDLSI